jgi:hypothetical protein
MRHRDLDVVLIDFPNLSVQTLKIGQQPWSALTYLVVLPRQYPGYLL